MAREDATGGNMPTLDDAKSDRYKALKEAVEEGLESGASGRSVSDLMATVEARLKVVGPARRRHLRSLR